jgi:aspartate/methionine/tyrosine aminotransferase
MTTTVPVQSPPPFAALRAVPYMGVISVIAEAAKLGFRNGHPEWCNLGQGQPEVGPIEGAPPRISSIALDPEDHAYGPLGGTESLRHAVAEHYNRLFRRGKKSQYTAANVSVASGGRLALSRIFATLGPVDVGYQIPDYTAYEDLISYHDHRFRAVLLIAREANDFVLTADELSEEARQRGLGAFLLSNPCNPTGQVVSGDELSRYVAAARHQGFTLILDEFYSHFIYTQDGQPGAGPVSAAAYVDDVDRDPVLLVDGLTKNFRYPGWRLGWVVGPREMIETIDRASSAIDGGPSQIVQRAALLVLDPERADQETDAVRRVFARKRKLTTQRLAELGIRPLRNGQGTFYVWASVAALAPPLDDGEAFFREALKHRVVTVPGAYFDVNPGKRRRGRSPFTNWVRFSFGPPECNVAMGLDRLEGMIGCP